MSIYPSVKDLKYTSKKEKWRDIIFKADTKEGRRFDILLLWAILLSVLAVMGESVSEINEKFGRELLLIEYAFTVLFTIEYVTRIMVSEKPKNYILSFWGIIDLLATLPTYLAFIFGVSQTVLIIRVFRLFRVFRVYRLTSFMTEAKSLSLSIKRSSAKITVFFVTVLIIVIVMGTVMYSIEPPEANFTSIPRSIYWAIVTLTTVGYGDITPVTPLGQFLSALLMILGYAVIAVPTGIVSVEYSQSRKLIACASCGHTENDSSSKFCKNCGNSLSK